MDQLKPPPSSVPPLPLSDLLEAIQRDLTVSGRAVHAFPPNLKAVPVTAVTSDSRQVGSGSVYVAVKGTQNDGGRFIQPAEAAGAQAIIGEDPAPPGLGVPYLQVSDARLALASAAAHFHARPGLGLLLIGVTGTSGKTTTTYLLESVLKAAGHRVGVIGTISFRFGDKVFDSTHTTPGPVELQALLSQMKAEGCTAVVMEVSSHALKQHRAACLGFDGMVFTNLSPEHLDFHPDMEDYFRSKSILFEELADEAMRLGKKPFAAVNGDDEYGRRLHQALLARAGDQAYRHEVYGLENPAIEPSPRLEIDLQGIRGIVGAVHVRSPFIGRFNAYNILGALTVCRGLGIPPEAISRGIESLPLVPGRLEKVPAPGAGSDGRAIPSPVHVLVDYAHKPDALEKVLKTLQEVRSGNRLITVFGCGGDRDRTKRPKMGGIAVALSDHVWVTSDNPRTESPEAIIREVVSGIPKPPGGSPSNHSVEPDRRQAIFSAIRMARPGDLVLIAGKGHEDYQIIADGPAGTRKIHFDDREVAAEALRERYSANSSD